GPQPRPEQRERLVVSHAVGRTQAVARPAAAARARIQRREEGRENVAGDAVAVAALPVEVPALDVGQQEVMHRPRPAGPGAGGRRRRASWQPWVATPHWRRLLRVAVRSAASRTFWTAGTSSPIRTARIAITTSSSISVKPARAGRLRVRMEVLLTQGQGSRR